MSATERAHREDLALALTTLNERTYRADPWLWAAEQVSTEDEARQGIYPWPADKVYLHELFDALERERLLAIPKSRRMMVSWAVCTWATHRARYYPHHAIFIQCDTEDKAAFFIDKRCAFIEDHLPAPYRRAYHALKTVKGVIGRLTYQETGSYLWAIPQGDNVIRAHTFSVLIADEMDFQPEGHRAFAAALPIAEKEAKLVLISTSNGPTGVIAGLCREVGFVRFT